MVTKEVGGSSSGGEGGGGGGFSLEGDGSIELERHLHN